MYRPLLGVFLAFQGCNAPSTEGAPHPEPVDSGLTAVIDARSSDGASEEGTRAPDPSTRRLEAVSGDGSVVIMNWPGTDPLVVRVIDGKGAGVAGVPVAWKVESGFLGMGTPDAITDSEGYARARIRGEFVSPSSSYLRQLVSVTALDERVTFRVTTMNDNKPSIPVNPHTQLEAPVSRAISGRVGATLNDEVIVAVAVQNGPSVGQPLAEVGVRIVDPNERDKPPIAHCAGGTVMTDDKGRARCDLVLDRAGTGELGVLIGGFNLYTLSATIN